ncbi:hypothetical protein NVP1110O_60 [Vibrio phage 1.110.O._10N.261.52.C1]|nr:hypothetical protein NVP1110O_60 [Vibrio phage 1.110.O._10N.261.52.C1]
MDYKEMARKLIDDAYLERGIDESEFLVFDDECECDDD